MTPFEGRDTSIAINLRPKVSPSYLPPVISAPIHSGQPYASVQRGIDLILQSNLFSHPSGKFFSSQLHQTIDSRWPFLSSHRNDYHQVFRSTLQVLRERGHGLILGGDHSVSMGTLPAYKSIYPNLKVLWVDAHTDINTPTTSPTGNLHGMPIAALLGLYPQNEESGWSWFSPCLKPEDIVYVGVRDTDPGEEVFLSQLGIRVYRMPEIRERGMGAVFEEIRKTWFLSDPHAPLLVSFDVDSLDPRYAPATGVPVAGGLNLNEALDIAGHIKSWQNLVGLEVVEFDPERVDHAYQVNLTRACIEKVIAAFY
jgi:arginase